LALTPLVGRDEEIDLLLRRWTRAETGDGQVVLISGEPGIGKSRVAAAFEERLQAQSHLRLRYFCSPYHQDSALHPFIDQLGRAAGFARDDSPAAKLEKLEAVLALAAPPEEDVTLLADLLSLPVSERHPLPNLSPQRKKERTLEALLQQLDGLARQHPILMVFEDAHWVDPTSRELLDLTVERVGNLPILMIVTFRPEFQPSWTGQPQVTMLPLDRLDRRERIALVEQIAGGKALSDEVVAQIADRTDGVPLFVEEFTKSVLESGAPLVGIPTTLHDSLMARLDRWASVRRVAQIGAAIGREFPYALLRAVSRLPEDELRAALARLVESELVFQRGAPPDAVYAFKHALIQDAAHSSLLRSARQQLHAKIAETLEAQSPELMDTEPELFAQHYSEALLVEKAVGYWRRAGQRSIAKSTFVEAIAQLNRGLLLLATLPESRDRNQRELDLQVTLAFALRGMTGYGHSDVAKALRRAHTLVVDIEAVDSILHFSVVYGLTAVNLTGGKPRAALDQAQEFLRLAQCQSDPGLLAVGHTLVGHVLIAIGNYPTALSHLERAAALYSPAKRQTDALRFGTETGVQAFSTSACALWHCGYPDQAKHAADEGLRQARQSTHLISLAFAIFHICLAPTCAPPETAVETLVQELVAISSQNKYSVFLGWGLILQGWAIARRGQPGAGVERIREGLAMSQAVGSHLYEPIFLGLFADALAMTGETAKGLAVVAEALTISEAWGARGNDAELHRLQGKFLLRLPSSNWAEVETCYRRALAIARQQGTRGLELRAAISLARLLTDQERHDEARDLLAPVYGWFSEGFGTPDLKAARALLDELGGA
jgi:tetratricopeptide (TPR) repeat protein